MPAKVDARVSCCDASAVLSSPEIAVDVGLALEEHLALAHQRRALGFLRADRRVERAEGRAVRFERGLLLEEGLERAIERLRTRARCPAALREERRRAFGIGRQERHQVEARRPARLEHLHARGLVLELVHDPVGFDLPRAEIGDDGRAGVLGGLALAFERLGPSLELRQETRERRPDLVDPGVILRTAQRTGLARLERAPVELERLRGAGTRDGVARFLMADLPLVERRRRLGEPHLEPADRVRGHRLLLFAELETRPLEPQLFDQGFETVDVGEPALDVADLLLEPGPRCRLGRVARQSAERCGVPIAIEPQAGELRFDLGDPCEERRRVDLQRLALRVERLAAPVEPDQRLEDRVEHPLVLDERAIAGVRGEPGLVLERVVRGAFVLPARRHRGMLDRRPVAREGPPLAVESGEPFHQLFVLRLEKRGAIERRLPLAASSAGLLERRLRTFEIVRTTGKEAALLLRFLGALHEAVLGLVERLRRAVDVGDDRAQRLRQRDPPHFRCRALEHPPFVFERRGFGLGVVELRARRLEPCRPVPLREDLVVAGLGLGAPGAGLGELRVANRADRRFERLRPLESVIDPRHGVALGDESSVRGDRDLAVDLGPGHAFEELGPLRLRRGQERREVALGEQRRTAELVEPDAEALGDRVLDLGARVPDQPARLDVEEPHLRLLEPALGAVVGAAHFPRRSVASAVDALEVDLGVAAGRPPREHHARVRTGQALVGRLVRAADVDPRRLAETRRRVEQREAERIEEARLPGAGRPRDDEQARPAERLLVELDVERASETRDVRAADGQDPHAPLRSGRTAFAACGAPRWTRTLPAPQVIGRSGAARSRARSARARAASRSSPRLAPRRGRTHRSRRRRRARGRSRGAWPVGGPRGRGRIAGRTLRRG